VGDRGRISNDTAIAAGVVQVAQLIVAAGIPVLHIKSTPAMRLHVLNCLARETRSGSPGSGNLTACSVPAENALAVGPADAATAMYPLIQSMSFDDSFCVDGVCPPIIGNVVVYADADHPTTAFSHSFAPVLGKRLRLIKKICMQMRHLIHIKHSSEHPLITAVTPLRLAAMTVKWSEEVPRCVADFATDIYYAYEDSAHDVPKSAPAPTSRYRKV